MERELPPRVESTAYFVVAEALANAVKHARATKLVVTLAHETEVLVVEIDDDGVGGAAARDGMGPHGLADRVEAVGGRLTIDSRPGEGTQVVAELPCGS